MNEHGTRLDLIKGSENAGRILSNNAAGSAAVVDL